MTNFRGIQCKVPNSAREDLRNWTMLQRSSAVKLSRFCVQLNSILLVSEYGLAWFSVHVGHRFKLHDRNTCANYQP